MSHKINVKNVVDLHLTLTLHFSKENSLDFTVLKIKYLKAKKMIKKYVKSTKTMIDQVINQEESQIFLLVINRR